MCKHLDFEEKKTSMIFTLVYRANDIKKELLPMLYTYIQCMILILYHI